MSKDSLVDTKEYKGYTIETHQDMDPLNPRAEYDNFGHMYCWHRNWTLGDDGKRGYPADYPEPSDLEAEFTKSDVILPIYMYEHSGVALSTGNDTYPFNDVWDSGQVGYIVAWADEIRKEYSVKRITKAIREKVVKLLQSEVKTYSQYLNGEVYGYVIKAPPVDADDEDEDDEPHYYSNAPEPGRGEEIEDGSCWGFYGTDYMLEDAKSVIDWHIKHLEEEAAEQTERDMSYAGA